ncbi:hypothetical protein SAMN05518672_102315 [Chitinophaga sp. CF118]|nr:hypothetical protein SAMN05518672_102315 [Chitinophaga sp. CF118]
MSNTSNKFPPDAGTFISEKEALKYRDAYFEKEKKRHHHEDFTRAYFFGKEKLEQLLNYNEEIVGMRIYYGVDVDGDGIDDKKMVIYPVGKDGKDVIMYDTHHQAAATRSADTEDTASIATTSGGKALDGGVACPVECP